MRRRGCRSAWVALAASAQAPARRADRSRVLLAAGSRLLDDQPARRELCAGLLRDGRVHHGLRPAVIRSGARDHDDRRTRLRPAREPRL